MLNPFIELTIIPLFITVIGLFHLKFPPKSINYMYGYRFGRAMKSQGAWDYANKYFAKVLSILGIVLTCISVALYLIYSKNTETLGNISAVLIPLNVVLFFCAIIPTELEVREKFDQHGKPKE